MFDNKIASLERYEQFVIRVKSSAAVWGLKSVDGWCVSDSNNSDGIQVMPFWSDRAYAKQCAKDNWQTYTPTMIDLKSFTTKWLPGLAKDKLLVGTNWNVHLIGEEIEPLVLKERLEDSYTPKTTTE